MQPAIRTQATHQKDQEKLSLAGGLDCSDSMDVTRQEFAADADINNIVRRHGITTSGRTPQFAVVDYDTDLQQAHTAVEQAKAAYASLPQNLRDRYPNWRTLLNALDSGQLTLHMEDAQADGDTSTATDGDGAGRA